MIFFYVCLVQCNIMFFLTGAGVSLYLHVMPYIQRAKNLYRRGYGYSYKVVGVWGDCRYFRTLKTTLFDVGTVSAACVNIGCNQVPFQCR